MDVVGLDSLYAQITDRSETELSSTRERERTGRVSASLGLGKILGAFASLADLKGSAEASASGKRVETTKAVLAPEHKLRLLTETLSGTDPSSVYDDFDEAAQAASDLGDAVFVHGSGFFDAPQFYPGSDGVAVANKMGAFIFERNMRPNVIEAYEFNDRYFREGSKNSDTAGARIVMSASLLKCVGANGGHLGVSSHEAIFLRAHQGQDIGLRVFGSLFGIPGAYQVKPYAVWFCS